MNGEASTRVHGGDTSGNLLDFSVNVSPLGVPDGVRAALTEAASRVDRYPDPLCQRLCNAIGAAEALPPDYILCGNGASDLIFRVALARRPKRALVPAPTFSEYEAALSLTDCEIKFYPLTLEHGFRPRRDFLNYITPGTEAVFLCQPNNPTGVTVPQALLREIAGRCREIDCLLILDECFLGFLETPEAFTLKESLSEFPNLLILRAFTKLYGMAGARLGYALSTNTTLLEQMRLCGPPWSVSEGAQEAGVAALRETGYVRAVRNLIARERPKLYAALCALGLRVVPGEANFLLFQSPAPLEESLRKRGIFLRNCGNFHGLDDTWYRTAVRTEADNRRLVTALQEALWETRKGL